MKVGSLLLTGATGFVGKAFTTMPEASTAFSSVVALPREMDICDRGALAAYIESVRPETVLHLAAQSHVPTSFKDPRRTYEINFLGTLNLLEALAARGFRGMFLYVGSADAYGLVSEDRLPITEDVPLRPRNPYAVSKAAAESLCYQWSQTGPMKLVMMRPFNHIGPGQGEHFAIAGLAKQIAAIKRGQRRAVIKVGDIDVTRDFTDVRDVLRAYFKLLRGEQNGGIYNVCSGEERRVRDVLEQMLDIAGIDARIEQDPERMRPAEQRRVRGSFSSLERATGWRPEIPWQQSLRDILNYWEEQTKDA